MAQVANVRTIRHCPRQHPYQFGRPTLQAFAIENRTVLSGQGEAFLSPRLSFSFPAHPLGHFQCLYPPRRRPTPALPSKRPQRSQDRLHRTPKQCITDRRGDVERAVIICMGTRRRISGLYVMLCVSGCSSLCSLMFNFSSCLCEVRSFFSCACR